ncbi:MAG: alpha/beta hydrolase-fold protein [Chitinophagales bacterium]
MKKTLFLLCITIPCLAVAQNPSPAEILSKQPFVIGESITLYSQVLQEDRILNIYLPEGYAENDSTTYPVIYVLDGSADEDFIHIAGLTQFASFSWIADIEPSIVVGIANVDRRRDYTFPTTIEEDKINFPTTGRSAAFISFLDREVIPLINAQYKVNNNRTLIGQSLGGLLATEILFQHASMFNRYIIVSPSLWWDNESLLQQNRNGKNDLQNIPIYIAVGEEGKIMVRDAKALKKNIEYHNPFAQVHLEYIRGKDHGNILHEAVMRAFAYRGSEK